MQNLYRLKEYISFSFKMLEKKLADKILLFYFHVFVGQDAMQR